MVRSMFRLRPGAVLSFKTYVTTSEQSSIKTSGIIVIGDEILKGEVADTNSNFMTTRLHGLGVKVKKIVTIGDSLGEISNEIENFSNKYDYVITTGGIGPTHDDVTFEAVAKAFREPIILHPRLVELCKDFFQTSNVNAPCMKLARVPQSSKLTFMKGPHPKFSYPNVAVRNVYMFPGIPQLCQRSFSSLCSQLFHSTHKFYTKVLYFNTSEDKIVQALNVVVEEFTNVLIGSYPQLYNSSYKVKVTIESTRERETIAAYRKLLQLVPNEIIVKM